MEYREIAQTVPDHKIIGWQQMDRPGNFCILNTQQNMGNTRMYRYVLGKVKK